MRLLDAIGYSPIALLLLNSLNKDREVIAPLFKIRRLGLRPLEPPSFLGQNCLIALPSTSLNKEVVTALSHLSRLAATRGVTPAQHVNFGQSHFPHTILFVNSCFSKEPRVCKPWFPNRGSRFPTKQRLN